MHYVTTLRILLLTALVCWFGAPTASAQSVGSCEQAIGEAYLDINNVRARILNNGNLFWRGSPNVYEVPKGGGVSANFASGIWIGGQVAGQLRVAGSTYGPYEFWAGPLDDNGAAPADCSIFDRVWKISREDITSYESSGIATPDLADWPTGLGAPTLDANGDPIDLTGQPLAGRADRKINLGAGERPDILGDQMVWWIMNDRGNQHNWTDTPAIGVEVHGSAFAFNTAGAIGNTTFYKYRIMYKGDQALENAYMGIFDDPDLGTSFDDYVGSDTTLGLGFVYNADNDDEGNYGPAPPAMGYDFFQGPLVNDNGLDDDEDGLVDEEDERLAMTSFAYFSNGGGVVGDPRNGADIYNYMQGRWIDGQRFTLGGDGRNFSNIPTSFAFPGNPGEFWSELNSDGNDVAIAPADRRFSMATGPFTIKPQDEQTLVFGIVTSFGEDNLDSVRKLKEDDALAQAVFDIDFQLPAPPAGPRVSTTVSDGAVLLEWSYLATDNNYLDSYYAIDPLLSSDVTDNDYEFEGYMVYQYSHASDQEGTLIATYDKVNGVTRVIEGTDLTFVTAEGTDAGIQHSHQVSGLTNYTDYEFGVQAYAYNATSGQKVYAGPVTRVRVVPQRSDIIVSDDAVAASRSAEIDIEGSASGGNIGNGTVTANVVNPYALTGSDYAVDFYSIEVEDDGHKRGDLDAHERAMPRRDAAKSSASEVTVYDIMNTTTGAKVFDGEAAYASTHSVPIGANVVQAEGLSLNVNGPAPGFLDFAVTANASGPLAEPIGGSADWGGWIGETLRPTGQQQVALINAGLGDSARGWLIAAGGQADNGYSTFLNRWARNGDVYGAADYEIRFTGNGKAFVQWGCGQVIDVPFELWNTGVGTPDDPSDDFQYVPFLFDENDNCEFDLLPVDHPQSGGSNDPYTDWIYWYFAPNGYAVDIATLEAGTDNTTFEVFGRTVFVAWNLDDVSDGSIDADPSLLLPEIGTVFRITTTKPNQPGDSFAFSTDGLGARERTLDEARAAIDDIGVTPNPYKGASSYEVSQLVDEVRFTNMPNQATIRVFTLAGTLIRTLEKNSASASFPWDLTTDDGLPIASGMYVIHVETELGEKVLKLGVVKKRVQLNNF